MVTAPHGCYLCFIFPSSGVLLLKVSAAACLADSNNLSCFVILLSASALVNRDALAKSSVTASVQSLYSSCTVLLKMGANNFSSSLVAVRTFLLIDDFLKRA